MIPTDLLFKKWRSFSVPDEIIQTGCIPCNSCLEALLTGFILKYLYLSLGKKKNIILAILFNGYVRI